jgi:hypothetical protein
MCVCVQIYSLLTLHAHLVPNMTGGARSLCAYVDHIHVTLGGADDDASQNARQRSLSKVARWTLMKTAACESRARARVCVRIE